MRIGVRQALLTDVHWLMSRLLELSNATDTKRKLFEDNEYSRSGIADFINRQIMLIACDDERPVGFIGGYFVPHIFNPKTKMLSEMFWWVDKDARGTAAAGRLLHEFIAYGKKHADWIVFGLSEHTPVKEENLLKLGFKPTERSYLMEVN